MAEREGQELAYRVERAIGLLPEVNLNDLRVIVHHGHVRLEGVVPTYAAKHAAIQAARQVEGVLSVEDALAVETPHPPRDAELSEELDVAIEAEGVDLHRMGGEAAHGEAILVGTARSLDELTHAVHASGSVPGTVEVVESARIDNPYGPDQIDLVDAVASAFARHPVLRTRGIRPLLEEAGKILLVGEVRHPDEKVEALRVAAAVPGVQSVREELETIP